MANLQLAKNMYDYRVAHNYTQDQISKMMHITRQAYSNYETGKRDPDVDLVVKLAQLYGITLDQMILEPYSLAIFRESRPPYVYAAEPETESTLFLSVEELEMVMKFRTADDDDRRLTHKILDF